MNFQSNVMVKSLFVLLALFILPLGGFASSEKSHATEHKQAIYANAFPVIVDVVVDEIRNVSISDGQFELVAEVLLSWTLPDSFKRPSEEVTLIGDPMEEFLSVTWDPGIYLPNAESPRETMARSLTVYPNGKVELYEKFAAPLSMETDIPSYPFGILDLHLEMKSSNHAIPDAVLHPRKFDIGHHDSEHTVVKGNWRLEGHRSEVVDVSSLSHGGKSRFSVAVFHLALSHDFVDVVQKIFIPLFSVLLLSLVINRYSVIFETESGADNGSWRVGGQLTLLLTLFALRFALGEDVPATHYVTMIDALFITVSLVVVITLVWGIYIIYLFQAGRKEAAQTLESRSNLVMLAITLSLLAWVASFALR